MEPCVSVKYLFLDSFNSTWLNCRIRYFLLEISIILLIGIRLMYLWETGLTRFWIIHLLASADVCFDKKPPKAADKPTPIKLVDLASAFLVLGIGLGLGIICFISEIMQHRLCKRFRV